MTQEELVKSALKEYFTACLLAVATSFVGLTDSDGMPGRGLWVVGLIALVLAAFVYFQFRQQSDTDGEKIPVSLSKLRRMAVLWYVLTLALGAALVKNLFQSLNTAGVTDWLMSILGLAAFGFSVFRIVRILTRQKV